MTTDTAKRCPCMGDTLDKFIQPIILLILNRGSCSGYGVVKQMELFPLLADNTPDTTGVYRQIKALEKKGAVEAVEEKDEQGTVRKRYVITSEGRACLENWGTTLAEYRMGITQLMDEIDHGLREGGI